MANTYVIQSVTYNPASGTDPVVTITGTVNNVPVIATCWLSVYQQHAASAISAQNFIISLMLAVYTPPTATAPPNAPPPGQTVVQ